MSSDGRVGMLTAGVDIGGTKTAVIVTDERDHTVHHAEQPTERGRLADQLIVLLRAAISAVAPVGAVEAVGIAAPGQVDRDAGIVHLAVNLGSRDVDLRGPVTAALGLPCAIEHDTRAAAIWLHERAASNGGTPTGNLAYLALGTGVSAGIIVDGRVVRGAHGLAGEVGHIVADPNGPDCGCGLRGCLEALVSGPAIARRGGADTAQEVFARAAAGDADAVAAVAELAGHLARALRSLVLGFGVERLFVGGGVAAAGEALRQPLLAAINDERRASALVERAFASTSIELLSPDSAAGARGAALVARRALAERTSATSGGKAVGLE